MYERLQNLLKLVVGKIDCEKTRILDFYAEDFCEEKLRSQLKIFSVTFPAKERLIFQDINDFFKNMNSGSLKFEAQKSFYVIQTALQYKPLYNTNRSEKWGKINTNRGL